MIGLTFGTGMGGGIIIDKQIYHGERGFAAELGHLVIEADGARCFCGGRGCLEMYASATGLKRFLAEAASDDAKKTFLDRIGKSVGEVMPLDMATAAASGDPFAASLFQRFGHYLGLGMASMVNVLGIYTIVIGGGISRSWDLFIGEARRAFQQQSYIETARITEIKRAKLGDNAGIIGAAVGAARLVR